MLHRRLLQERKVDSSRSILKQSFCNVAVSSFYWLVVLQLGSLILPTTNAWVGLGRSNNIWSISKSLHHKKTFISGSILLYAEKDGKAESDELASPVSASSSPRGPRGYSLGAGRNKPFVKSHNKNSTAVNTMKEAETEAEAEAMARGVDKYDELHWYAPHPVSKPKQEHTVSKSKTEAVPLTGKQVTKRKMVARSEEGNMLRGAIWHEQHFDEKNQADTVQQQARRQQRVSSSSDEFGGSRLQEPELFYPDIDLSIPESVYSRDRSKDIVWDLMRWEAFQEAQREPLLVSFLHSNILNHHSLESSLAFLLANRLSSSAMISTQIQSLILDALNSDPTISRSLRADIMAVRDRDPACTCLPDVFLYFKGFHALQTYRVAHAIWKAEKHVLAHYLQSQMSQIFQIDIHPNATLGSGIMLDHGTGIVIGETAHVGHNCSILHHVTLGGSGKKGVDRHPKVGDGVLLGAGASVLGNVRLGDGCQVGAGTLVITDLPPHCVAVGVPAKIIGSFVDVTEQPSIGMNQMMDAGVVTFQSDGI